MLGTDPEQLEQCAIRFATAATELRAILQLAAGAFAGLQWDGPDRWRFEHQLRDCMPIVVAPSIDALSTAAGTLRRHAAEQRRVSSPSDLSIRYTLEHTPDTEVVSIGNPWGAAHVILLVPGVGSGVDHMEGLLQRAQRIHEAALAESGTDSVATIAWQGYEAPQVQFDELDDIMSDDRARAASVALRALLTELDDNGRVDLTVVGHSYGSLVAAFASRDDDAVEHLIALGSPGLGVDNIADLDLGADATAYQASAPGDLVAQSGWFGERPDESDFGAVALEIQRIEGVSAHSSYFESEPLLDEIGYIATREAPSES
jgi:pimeloyl-ACP methyl ester carboxylesterase